MLTYSLMHRAHHKYLHLHHSSKEMLCKAEPASVIFYSTASPNFEVVADMARHTGQRVSINSHADCPLLSPTVWVAYESSSERWTASAVAEYAGVRTHISMVKSLSGMPPTSSLRA